MAYKRQTSFSPFSSKREVSSKDANDQLALAKALESQRKQSVKEFAGASSQQIEELSRIDRIARQKDEYEIQELSRFSQSLNSALQTGAKVLGKQYIEGQKAKGADAYANDPFDPLAIEQEISTLRDKNLTVIDEIEKSENEKRILNLEEKIKLHEARMKRGNWGIGYTKAYLAEVGNGFLPHLNLTVSDDDSYFQEPEVDPLTLEPIEGTGIRFSEYYAQDLETKKKMDQAIFLRYKEKHGLDGINARYLNKYLNEPAAEILNRWSANELNKSVIQNAEADTITFKFKNPSFSGVGTSSHYLTIENQEHMRKMTIKEEIKALQEQIERDAENTTLARFIRNLESRIYAQISRQIVENMFGETQSTEGTFELEGNIISYKIEDGMIILTIFNTNDGTTTEISLPLGDFSF